MDRSSTRNGVAGPDADDQSNSQEGDGGRFGPDESAPGVASRRQDSRGSPRTDGGRAGDASREGLLKQSATFGAAAWIAGLVVSYLLVDPEGFSEELQSIQLEGVPFDLGMQQPAEVTRLEMAGWEMYTNHFVPLQDSPTGYTSGAEIQQAMAAYVSAQPLTLVVYPALLVAAGYYLYDRLDADARTEDTYRLGGALAAGYLPLSILGATYFSTEIDMERMGGQPVAVTYQPDIVIAVLVMGLAYPLLFGSVGVALARRD